MSAVESIEPSEPLEPRRANFRPLPLDPLASHIATLLRTLDTEVERIRRDAEAGAEGIIENARAEAERIVQEAERRVAEADAARRDMLERRERAVGDLRALRDSIIDLASSLDPTDATARDRDRRAKSTLPPPPGRNEDQIALWSDDPDD
jgi:cell division septum initiation protein DivIVA